MGKLDGRHDFFGELLQVNAFSFSLPFFLIWCPGFFSFLLSFFFM
jgi:hypothetical protein